MFRYDPISLDGGSAVLDAELWINPLEMFSDGGRRNSED